MKKILCLLAAIILILVINIDKEDNYIIPKEAIRLRIVANSNNEEDQRIKHIVKKTLEQELLTTLKTKDIESARTSIKNNISRYEQVVKRTFIENNYDKPFNINFGYNYFPEKTYKGVTYKAGEYESLLINIGSAQGNNWWCVLFPPLCTLEVEENSEIEYRVFIKDFIDKYLK